jgi:DUF4097 and DUF4098 domain-containing protein YvlB
MRRRSITGPLLLLLIGSMFLWTNLHPETPIFDLVARYWPFVLIAWGLLRLLETMVRRRDGIHYGFSGGEIVLVILICVAGSGIWQAHEHGIRFNPRGLDWWGQQYDYPISVTSSAAGMKRIVFENPRGNIKVTGSDTTDVTVTGHKLIRAYSRRDADQTNDSASVEIVPQGDRLMVRTNQDRVPNSQRMSADIEVAIPRFMVVESRGGQGDYEIADLDGDLEISASHGDVRISRLGGNARLDIGRSDLVRALDVKGRIDLQGQGSDVEMENIAGQVTINGAYRGTLDFKNLAKPLQVEGLRNTELSVQAVPGRISMDLGAFTANDVVGPLRLVTRSRDIKVEKFSQSLEVETERGDIELTPGHLPLAAVEARTGVGKIELVLPDKAAFALEATAERGDATNDFGPQIRKDSEGRANTLKGKVGDGPTIKITANRGSISVRREGDSSEATPDAPPKSPMAPVPPKSPKSLKDSELKM